MVRARVHCIVHWNTSPSFVSIVCAEVAGQDGSSRDGCVLSWNLPLRDGSLMLEATTVVKSTMELMGDDGRAATVVGGNSSAVTVVSWL